MLFGLFKGRRALPAAPETPSVTFVANPDNLQVFLRSDPSRDSEEQMEMLGRVMARAGELSPSFSELVAGIVAETGDRALNRGFRLVAETLEKPMVSPTAVWRASE